MSEKRQLTRRDFMRLAASAAGGAILASCVPATVPPTPETAKPAALPEPTATPAEPEQVVLEFPNHWHVPTDAHHTAMEWVFTTFEDQNPNIKINSLTNPDKPEMKKKTQADCAAGLCPDILIETDLEYRDSGWLLDLTPYVDDEWKARLIPSMLDMTSWEGKTFGLALEFSPIDTIWNMRVLDKVGVDTPPTTWDEFLALGEALKGEELYLGTFAFGFDYHAPSAITFSQPGAAEAMGNDEWDNEYVLFAIERMKEIVDRGYHPPNDLELDWRQAIPLWQTDRMAMYMNGAWTIKNEITPEGVDPELSDHVKFTPFPSTGSGTSIELKMTTAISLAAHLADQPARLEAAIKFLDFWTSEEAAIHFVTDAQSPMGVKIPSEKMEAAQAQVPLLAAFLDAVDQADVVFSHGLPSKKLRARSWGLFVPAKDALLLGKSSEEALATWVEEMQRD